MRTIIVPFSDVVKILVVLCVIFLFLITYHVFGQTTDSQAQQSAKNLWGSSGFARHVGQNYQVGCQISGSTMVVASSKASYDDAFSKVNLQTNGLHTVTATVRSDTGETADSPPVTMFLCNP